MQAGAPGRFGRSFSIKRELFVRADLIEEKVLCNKLFKLGNRTVVGHASLMPDLRGAPKI